MLILKTKLFPLMLLACNLGSAVVYATAGEWKRAVYWGASSSVFLRDLLQKAERVSTA
jgi:hypothetical protein